MSNREFTFSSLKTFFEKEVSRRLNRLPGLSDHMKFYIRDWLIRSLSHVRLQNVSPIYLKVSLCSYAFPYFPFVIPCFLVVFCVFPWFSLFSTVFRRFVLFSHDFLCFSLILPVFLCFPLFPRVVLCFSPFWRSFSTLFRVSPCFSMFFSWLSRFFLRLPLFPRVFLSFSLFCRVFLRFPLFSHVFLCFSLILPVFQCFSTFLLDSAFFPCFSSGAPARAKRAWVRAPYSLNMVNLFSFGCHVIDRAYVRT